MQTSQPLCGSRLLYKYRTRLRPSVCETSGCLISRPPDCRRGQTACSRTLDSVQGIRSAMPLSRNTNRHISRCSTSAFLTKARYVFLTCPQLLSTSLRRLITARMPLPVVYHFFCMEIKKPGTGDRASQLNRRSHSTVKIRFATSKQLKRLII